MQYFIEISTPTKFHEILHHYRYTIQPDVKTVTG